MIVDSIKEQFDRDGFVIVRQLLPQGEFNVLRRELDRYIGSVVPTLPDSDAFYVEKGRPETLKQLQHMGRDPFFRDYPQHSVWSSLARTLVGEPVEGQE